MKLSELPFYDEWKHLDLIFVGYFGSKLYGTDSEKSDVDLVGVYIPTKREIFTSDYEDFYSYKTSSGNNKNTKDDVDIKFYSIFYFLKLLLRSDTGAIDLIHSTESTTIFSNWAWDRLRKDRSNLYCKNMISLLGYARSQATKYGDRGTRLKEIKSVIEFIDGYKAGNVKIGLLWNDLPSGEYIFKVDPIPGDKNIYKLYQICGQNFHETVSLDYMKTALEQRVNRYGDRARKAEAEKGNDWKAISHSVRASYQACEIFKMGTITYPLKIADYIKEIKYGKIGFEEASNFLNELLEEAEKLCVISGYPDNIDSKFWKDLLFNIVESNMLSLEVDEAYKDIEEYFYNFAPTVINRI